MISIQEFYNQHPFPGYYTRQQLHNYRIDRNCYISRIAQEIRPGHKVLDVGAGTGFITNLLADRISADFTGIDFAQSALWAEKFARTNSIDCAHFYQQDLFNHHGQYDRIIAQSVLTHVPEYSSAVQHLKSLLRPGGRMIIGLYVRSGQWARQFVQYTNTRLELDQRHCPFEQAFTDSEIRKQFSDYKLVTAWPSINNRLVDLANLFNGRNGGLTLYVVESQ